MQVMTSPFRHSNTHPYKCEGQNSDVTFKEYIRTASNKSHSNSHTNQSSWNMILTAEVLTSLPEASSLDFAPAFATCWALLPRLHLSDCCLRPNWGPPEIAPLALPCTAPQSLKLLIMTQSSVQWWNLIRMALKFRSPALRYKIRPENFYSSVATNMWPGIGQQERLENLRSYASLFDDAESVAKQCSIAQYTLQVKYTMQ